MQDKSKHDEAPPLGDYGPTPQSEQQPSINVYNQNVQQQQQQYAGGGGGGRVSTQLTMGEVLGHFVIWALISCFTLGIGLLFWPYAAAKMILDSMVIDGHKMRCGLSISESIGHIILWGILIVVTMGLAAPFYFFGVVRTAINRTTFG